MKASIRELRIAMKQILGAVQHYGEEVIIYSRNKPIAKIIPYSKKLPTREDYGFGMWGGHEDMSDVDQYVRKLRKGRRRDI
jgi:prevent-host-death family protein